VARRYFVYTALGALATVSVVMWLAGTSMERRAELLGAALSDDLTRLAQTSSPPVTVGREPSPTFSETYAAVSISASEATQSASSLARVDKKKKKTSSAPGPRDIHVPAGTVLRWARDGVMPGAVSVPATKTRPAGIRLSGVAGLGIGARDGDVLTHVEGRAVHSVPEVIGVVVAALGKKQTAIGGRLYRDDQHYSITVEIPSIRTQGLAQSPRR
jgi:hypothetical protein